MTDDNHCRSVSTTACPCHNCWNIALFNITQRHSAVNIFVSYQRPASKLRIYSTLLHFYQLQCKHWSFQPRNTALHCTVLHCYWAASQLHTYVRTCGVATPPDGATKHTINGHAVVRTTRMRAGRVINAEVGSDNFCDETKEGGGRACRTCRWGQTNTSKNCPVFTRDTETSPW